MEWICEQTGGVLHYSVLEPMNKPTFCTYCGQVHQLTPGKWSPEDEKLIDQIKEGVSELDDEETYQYLDLSMETMASPLDKVRPWFARW